MFDLCSNDCKMILNKRTLNHIKRYKNDLVMTLGAGDISDLVAQLKNIKLMKLFIEILRLLVVSTLIFLLSFTVKK